MQRLEGLSADLNHLRVQVGELRLDTAALRGDLTAAIEQTNVNMRVLHEEVLHEEVLDRLRTLR